MIDLDRLIGIVAVTVFRIVVTSSTLITGPLAEAGSEDVCEKTIAAGPPGVIVWPTTVVAVCGLPVSGMPSIVLTIH